MAYVRPSYHGSPEKSSFSRVFTAKTAAMGGRSNPLTRVHGWICPVHGGKGWGKAVWLAKREFDTFPRNADRHNLQGKGPERQLAPRAFFQTPCRVRIDGPARAEGEGLLPSLNRTPCPRNPIWSGLRYRGSPGTCCPCPCLHRDGASPRPCHMPRGPRCRTRCGRDR